MFPGPWVGRAIQREVPDRRQAAETRRGADRLLRRRRGDDGGDQKRSLRSRTTPEPGKQLRLQKPLSRCDHNVIAIKKRLAAFFGREIFFCSVFQNFGAKFWIPFVLKPVSFRSADRHLKSLSLFEVSAARDWSNCFYQIRPDASWAILKIDLPVSLFVYPRTHQNLSLGQCLLQNSESLKLRRFE